MKLFLGPKHKSLCPSSWEFIELNTNCIVLLSVKTSPPTLIARTTWRTRKWTTYLTAIIPSPPRKRTNLQTNLFIYFRTVPRRNRTVTRRSQSLQTGTPPRNRTESTLRKSQTRTHTQPVTSTATAWTFYHHQKCDKHHLSNSRRWRPRDYQDCPQESSGRTLSQRRIPANADRRKSAPWPSKRQLLRAFHGTASSRFK